MSLLPLCIFRRGSGPVVAAAIHNGHDTRRRVDECLKLTEAERLHEEDPYTAEWAQMAPTQIVAMRSRFEVDLNRPRDKAVYRSPEDAWGYDVWATLPDQLFIDESLREYDVSYRLVARMLRELVAEHGRVVVYDLHSYNYRRNGVVAPAETHPEVNIGTGTMDRAYWTPVVDRFIDDLRTFDFDGRSLDVRENVKFRGGYFGRWIHQMFPETACSLAVEFKKFFMDEWSGEANLREIELIYSALQSTLPGVRAALESMGKP